MEALAERLAPLASFRESFPQPHPSFDYCTGVCELLPGGDPRTFTLEEIVFEARKILFERPQFFLERFGHLITEDELTLFEHLNDEVSMWVEKLRRRMQVVPVKVRMRRRKAHLEQTRSQPGGYFCEQEMAQRNPELFHELLGQYGYAVRQDKYPGPVTAILLEQLDRELKRRDQAAKGEQAKCEGKRNSNACLSDVDELSPSKKARIESTWHAFVQECDMTSSQRREDTDAVYRECGGSFTTEETRCTRDGVEDREREEERRIDFVRQMEERFIHGIEDFDYRDVDENSRYDDMEMVIRDAEDDYFST